MKASSRQTLSKKRWLIPLAAVLLIVLLGTVGRGVVSKIAAVVFTPVVLVQSWFYESSSTLPTYFRDRSVLLDRIEELEKRLAFENVDDNTTARLLRENNRLRSLLGNEGEERIAAGIIGRPTMTPYDVLILDKGSDDGIVASAPVYAGFDQVIGFVAEVYSHSAVVTLATTPNFESTVYIYGPNIYTTAKGLGGGILEVSVPQGIVLSERDLVILPTFGSGVFGSISLVESVATEPEQRGYVTLRQPVQSLNFVSVGKEALNTVNFETAKEAVEKAKEELLRVPVPEGILVDVESSTTSSSSLPVAEEAEEANE